MRHLFLIKMNFLCCLRHDKKLEMGLLQKIVQIDDLQQI